MAIDPNHGELVPLGTGPAATVLAGVDDASGMAFALKVYRGKLDRHTRAALDAELTSVRALSGPVLVADSVEETSNGHCALRMELCAQSLTELVASFGPLSVADTLALGETLAKTLTAAHRAGIVHGGVTPGNVLFRPSGEPVLSDFGLTLRRAFPRDPERDVDLVAPETLRDGSADERSDLYGLGVVLYLALAGTSPHQGAPGEQHGERVLRVLTGVAPAVERPDLPPGLEQLVASLLAKNPDARPLDMATVAARLGPMIGPGAPTQLPRTAPPVAFPRPRGEPIVVFGPRDQKDEQSRRRRTGLVAVVLAALSVLAVLAVLLLLNSPNELDVPSVPPPVTQPSLSTPPSAPAAQLELADPIDRGDFAELSWRSTLPLDFAVIVEAEGEAGRPVFVQRNTSYLIPVDPVRSYCFRVRGADSANIYESELKPFRRAGCKK